MPSPFPGMDPYLEEEVYFHPIHQRLIAIFSEQLQPLLPEAYWAELGNRRWSEPAKPPPDAVVQAMVRAARARRGMVQQNEPLLVHVPIAEMSEWFLDISIGHDDREQLVTTIEVLSISNKTEKEKGRDLYLEKQQKVLESDIHLVEIDLLRGGQHTTAVPLAAMKEKLHSWDYHVCIKRFDKVEKLSTYPIPLPERLPILAIPLLPGDGAVPLDLQKALDHIYDNGPYPRRVRYTTPVPPPALSEERAAWVQQVLRAAGKLKS